MAAQNTTSAHVFLVTNISSCATDRGLRQCFGTFGAYNEISYVKSSSQALVTIEGISPEGARKLSNQQELPCIGDQRLQVIPLFKEDIVLRLADVDRKLIGYIQQLAKERGIVCQKVNSCFEVTGPFGLVDQFRNELSVYALKMSEGLPHNPDIIAAIACTISWQQLGGYLATPPYLLGSKLSAPATQEDGILAVLRQWESTEPQATWQRLAQVLEGAGHSALAQQIRKYTTSPGTSPAAEDQGASGYARSEPANQAISGLSPDVLSLMLKLHDGGIQGVVCDQLDKGCVTVCGSSDNEVEANIARFQSAYQGIHNKVKVDVVQYSSTVDHASITKAVDDLNQTYKDCVLMLPHGTGTVRIVSSVPRQLDQARLQLQGLFNHSNTSPVAPTVAQGASVGQANKEFSNEYTIELKAHRMLSLKKSDIMKEKVAVLVSNTKGARTDGVARVTDPASCSQIQYKLEKYVKEKGPVSVGDVVSTHAGGGLPCKNIYHVICPDSSCTLDQCKAWLEKAVNDIVQMGEKDDVKSVAMPALNAGALSKDVVAQVMVSTILNHQFKKKPSALADIRIVISDEATYACFAQCFAQKSYELATSSSGACASATATAGLEVSKSSSAVDEAVVGGSSVPSSQPCALITEQPGHRKLSLRSSSTSSDKASSAKAASPTVALQGLPPLVDPAKPEAMERGTSHARQKRKESEKTLRSDLKTESGHSSISGSSGNMDATECSICRNPLNNPTTTSCGHTFCSKCLSTATKQDTHPRCPMCRTPITKTIEACPICMSIVTDPVTTDCCRQTYCRKCLNDCLKASSYCPTCKHVVRKLMGNQPPGTMSVTHYQWSLPGYEDCNTIVITYHIPDGIQGPEHPNPGRYFYGTKRTAYLPDNAEGGEVLALLQKAWEARMIFTVGTSVTTGATDCVVWNDIHHKTSTTPGAYGYPDMTYLKRVKHELASRGITLDDN